MFIFANACALNMPATLPGTPDADAPNLDMPSMGLPFSSKYISLCALLGAASRKSMPIKTPALFLDNKNPPPPILPAPGKTTARVN